MDATQIPLSESPRLIQDISKTLREMPLAVELVPRTCWFSNVRDHVSRSDWEKCKNFVKERSGSRCEICGGVGSRYPVDCHEIWSYDDVGLVQTLVGLIALCPPCHEVKHIGLAEKRGRMDRAYAHFLKVNGLSDAKGINLIGAAFDVWNWRSARTWELDITYLDLFGIIPNKSASFR